MARTNKPDPRGGHVRLYWDLHDSMAWRSLSASSKALYVAMRRDLRSTNNGNISATLGDLKHRGIRSSATLAKGLRELQTVGLIAMTRQGGVAWGKKICSLYRFTDEDTFDHVKLGIAAGKATHEWKNFSTLAQATRALKQAHANAKRTEKVKVNPLMIENEVGLQEMNAIDSQFERKERKAGSDAKAVTASLVHKLRQSSKVSATAKPRAA